MLKLINLISGANKAAKEKLKETLEINRRRKQVYHILFLLDNKKKITDLMNLFPIDITTFVYFWFFIPQNKENIDKIFQQCNNELKEKLVLKLIITFIDKDFDVLNFLNKIEPEKIENSRYFQELLREKIASFEKENNRFNIMAISSIIPIEEKKTLISGRLHFPEKKNIEFDNSINQVELPDTIIKNKEFQLVEIKKKLTDTQNVLKNNFSSFNYNAYIYSFPFFSINTSIIEEKISRIEDMYNQHLKQHLTKFGNRIQEIKKKIRDEYKKQYEDRYKENRLDFISNFSSKDVVSFVPDISFDKDSSSPFLVENSYNILQQYSQSILKYKKISFIYNVLCLLICSISFVLTLKFYFSYIMHNRNLKEFIIAILIFAGFTGVYLTINVILKRIITKKIGNIIDETKYQILSSPDKFYTYIEKHYNALIDNEKKIIFNLNCLWAMQVRNYFINNLKATEIPIEKLSENEPIRSILEKIEYFMPLNNKKEIEQIDLFIKEELSKKGEKEIDYDEYRKKTIQNLLDKMPVNNVQININKTTLGQNIGKAHFYMINNSFVQELPENYNSYEALESFVFLYYTNLEMGDIVV